MELSTIPSTVQAVFTPKSHQPLEPPIRQSETGIYVPKISKNIEQWSNILKTFFAVLCVIAWYSEENEYKIIKLAP